jgi:hypothetical protein
MVPLMMRSIGGERRRNDAGAPGSAFIEVDGTYCLAFDIWS